VKRHVTTMQCGADLSCSSRATIPAASGADADVPE